MKNQQTCVFSRTASLAPGSFHLVAKGNSRQRPCGLLTDLTLTPEVTTLCMCVLSAYVSDLWSR